MFDYCRELGVRYSLYIAYEISHALHENCVKGPFNNYVEKMRGGGGPKMSVFVHAQGIKNVHAGMGGQKMAKFCPRSC